MKKFIIILILFVANISYAKKYTIAIALTVSHPALEVTLKGIKDSLKNEYGENLDLIIKNAQGNVLLANQIASKLISIRPDAMIGLGTMTSQALAKVGYYKPLIFSSVTDPESAGLLNYDNVSGVSNFVNPDIQFKEFAKLNYKKLGIIYNPGEINSTRLVEKMKESAQKFNINLELAAAMSSKDVSSAASLLASKKVDAIFINNDNTALSAFSSIIKIASKYQISVISSDLDNIEIGADFCIGPDQYKIGLMTAKLVIDQLNNIQTEKVIYANQIEIKQKNN